MSGLGLRIEAKTCGMEGKIKMDGVMHYSMWLIDAVVRIFV